MNIFYMTLPRVVYLFNNLWPNNWVRNSKVRSCLVNEPLLCDWPSMRDVDGNIGPIVAATFDATLCLTKIQLNSSLLLQFGYFSLFKHNFINLVIIGVPMQKVYILISMYI